MSARLLRVMAALAVLALLGGGTRAARAQEAVGRLIQEARVQLEAPNPDSVVVLLEKALSPEQNASVVQQTRAWVLYGIAQLFRENRPAARQAFRQALQRDPSLRIDSLYFFHDEIEREFGAELAAIAPPVVGPAPAVLTVTVDLPADTTVPASGGRLRISGSASYPARVVAIVTPADVPATIVWSDTQQVGAGGTRAWNLRGRDGQLVAPGRYTLSVKAVDSLGQVSPTIERVLLISRVPADTQALPPPPTFAPETLRLRGSPTSLAVGLALGAAAVALPTALGSPDLNSGLQADQTSYAVAGAVSVAGIVGFLAGHRVRPIPQNIQRNRELRERYAYNRQTIAQLNARARENAPVRVQVEGTVR